jgi:hypothetical protein
MKRPLSAGWRTGFAILPVTLLALGCGQPQVSPGSSAQPANSLQQDDSLQRELNEMLSSDPDGDLPSSTAASGISQSSEINQSTSGSGTGSSSSVSTSQQTIDNGDGTVTIIETRTVDGKTETTRKTVRRSETNQNQAPSQSIEQRIEQK